MLHPCGWSPFPVFFLCFSLGLLSCFLSSLCSSLCSGLSHGVTVRSARAISLRAGPKISPISAIGILIFFGNLPPERFISTFSAMSSPPTQKTLSIYSRQILTTTQKGNLSLLSWVIFWVEVFSMLMVILGGFKGKWPV